MPALTSPKIVLLNPRMAPASPSPSPARSKKEAHLVEDTSCASWALKGGIQENNVSALAYFVNSQGGDSRPGSAGTNRDPGFRSVPQHAWGRSGPFSRNPIFQAPYLAYIQTNATNRPLVPEVHLFFREWCGAGRLTPAGGGKSNGSGVRSRLLLARSRQRNPVEGHGILQEQA